MRKLIDTTFLNSLHRKLNFDLLVLNGGNGDASLLGKLGRAAKHVFCADGGAVALHKWAPTIKPELICGDLDSITGTAAETHYRDIGVPIIKIFDQDRTDFQKSLTYWRERVGGGNIVVVWCNSDGTRTDHDFSNYNTLFKHIDDFPSLILMSQKSAIAVIQSGETVLRVADCMLTTETVTNYCGLIPLFGPVRNIESEGLKWNCGPDCSKLEFGVMISTSNEVIKKEVVFKTSDPFLITLTMNFHPKFFSSQL